MRNHHLAHALPLPLLVLVLVVAACGGAPESAASRDGTSVEETRDVQTDPLTTSDLPKEQSAVVLKLLDDICGDTWCEGEYDWHFPKIVCHFSAGTCTLTFRITDANEEPPKTYWRSCRVEGFERFEDMVETAPNGYQSLKDAFYTKVSTCIEGIEDHLASE